MAATVAKTERAPIERTEHPHVVRSAGTLGGKSRIDNTRISVGFVYVLYSDGQESPEAIAETYRLPLAHLLDALSYAFDHPEEMADFKERQQLRSVLRYNNMVYAGGRLIPVEQLDHVVLPTDVPAYTWETLPAEFDH